MANYANYSPGNIADHKFTYKNDDGEFHLDQTKGKAIYKFTPGDGSFYSDPLTFVRFATLRLDDGQTDHGLIYKVPNESFFLFFSLVRLVDNHGDEFFRFYFSLDGNTFERWLTESGTHRFPLEETVPDPPPETTGTGSSGGQPGSGTATTFPLTIEHSNTNNETKAFGNAKISKQPDKGLIELNVRVKKTGTNGTGFGYGQVALFDKDGNTLFTTNVVSENVGADLLAGAAEDDHTESFEFPLSLLKITANGALIIKAKDNNGLPNSIEDFTASLNKIRDFLKAVSGVLEEVVKIVAIIAAA